MQSNFRTPQTPSILTWARLLTILALAVAIYGVCMVLALSFGSSSFGHPAVLLDWLRGDLDENQTIILSQARLPRVWMAGLVGASLAVSGAVFQAVLRNPLADPYILGISGGAALGGTLYLTLGSFSVLGVFIGGLELSAFSGAMLALLLILSLARWTPAGTSGTYVLLLTGVMVNAFAASAIMFLQSVVTSQKAQEILFYLMGTLAVEGLPTTTLLGITTVIAFSLSGIFWFARDLNAMTLGDEEAASLGISVQRTRWIVMLLSSLAVAVGVAFTGIIGFVGLVVPHGLRLLIGSDHRLLLPLCAIGGAAFLTLADLLARASFAFLSTTLPVGVITSFIGVPLFMVFLFRSLRTRVVSL